jgi:hypothetical protein
MIIRTVVRHGRRMWELDNGALTLAIAVGGGHLAELRLAVRPEVNPFWIPPWKSMEPWTYRPPIHDRRYSEKLLASILGHNLCLSYFGPPSEEEKRQGLGAHGEAPVARWKALEKRITKREIVFSCGCDLPLAGMRVIRQYRMKADEPIVWVRSRFVNELRHDRPFTCCEHATFGSPFVEAGVTLFDMSATRGHTFPGAFSDRPRVVANASFDWPLAPGVSGGTVDLRTLAPNCSDFTAQLMDPAREQAWMGAVHPRFGLAVVYAWPRRDYPWLGNWEEHHARQNPPWNGKTVSRGMEFSNSPFPEGLRKAVDRGSLFGEKTFQWLPARGSVETEFVLTAVPVGSDCQGIRDVRFDRGEGMTILWR